MIRTPVTPAQGLDRRSFLKLSGFGLALSGTGILWTPARVRAADGVELNQYIVIRPDGRIQIAAPNPDVGQGVNTSLPMIVAEFLDADWSDVDVVLAPVDASRYGFQFAGGSRSVPDRWEELRLLGATAREMLLQTAAREWSVPRDELTTEPSRVVHGPSGRQASYGELSVQAGQQPVPDASAVPFREASDYRLLGTPVLNTSADAIVRGERLFGIDTVVPDMVYANYVKCPRIGGVVKTANVDAVKQLPGVIDAFVIDGDAGTYTFRFPDGVYVASGVAIVAENTWAAIKARRTLDVEWDFSAASSDDSDTINAAAAKAAEGAGQKELHAGGDVDAAFGDAAITRQAFYQTDFISHAQLEPQSCVASATDDGVEVWTSSQTPTAARTTLAELFGLPETAITVHQVRGGGGFGRRLSNEYVREAALIARRVGRPVKLQWTREDDMAFDYYRSASYFALAGAVTGDGRLLGWRNHVISGSRDGEGANYGAGYSNYNFPTDVVENVRITQTLIDSDTPTGPWRAPVSNVYAFAEQSFLHELALASGRDHRDFLLDALGEERWIKDGDRNALNTTRAKAVIRAVTEAAGWGRSLPQGHGLGLSFFFSHAGHVAEVAEVSVDDERRVRVHKVWVTADVGQVINLSGLENQVQGSVIDGLSAMAAQRITVREGRIEQSNFHEYSLLRINKRPAIEVSFLASGYPPTGAGEPALPPLAPAVCNAIYAASGHRIRSLPISREGFTV